MRNYPPHYLLPVLLALFFLLSANVARAQTEEELKWAEKEIQATSTANKEDRYRLVSRLLERLEKTKGPSLAQRELVHFLKIQKSYLQIDGNGFSKRINEGTKATSDMSRQASLNLARIELLNRIGSLAQVLTPDNLSAEDAKNILSALKAASQALDDIRDPSLIGGKTSGITELFGRAGGLMDFVSAIKDPQAKEVVSAFDEVLGSVGDKLTRLGISHPNPVKVFDFAFAGTAAQMQVTREGIAQSTDALQDIGAAISGDEAALNRLPGHAERVGKTLSSENWGRAIANSMADRLADSIPFVRTLAKLVLPATGRIPTIERTLRLEVRCSGGTDGKFAISQIGEKVKAVALEDMSGCYQKGETLFEGDYWGNSTYRIVIHKIWLQNEKRSLISGNLIVQSPGFIRMQSPLLDGPGSKYLFR